MAEIIKFPTPNRSDGEEGQKYTKYYELLDSLGVLESKLKAMAEEVDGLVFAEIHDKAHDLLVELQVELADMREKKFFSPVKRREILKRLRELRKIWKESEPLFEEYEKTSFEIYHLGKELGISEED